MTRREGDRRRRVADDRPRWPAHTALAVGLLTVFVWQAHAGAVPQPWEAFAGVAYVAAATGELTRTDLAEHRLPNAITGPGTFFCAASAGAVWAENGSFPAGELAVWADTVMVLALLHVLGGIGMGDVKLGAMLGLALGPFGAQLAVVCLLIAFVAGGAAAAILLTSGRMSAAGRMPFGPFLLLGFWASASVAG
jgi:leader peptidase (prepilin peptidase)/N-methyltransferase